MQSASQAELGRELLVHHLTREAISMQSETHSLKELAWIEQLHSACTQHRHQHAISLTHLKELASHEQLQQLQSLS